MHLFLQSGMIMKWIKKKGGHIKKIIFFILPLIFLIIYPYTPSVGYTFFKKTITITSTTITIYKQNTLLIPSIGVAIPIIEGATDEALRKGAWHLPSTGTPLYGNMVIGGHRFAYLPPNNTTFYSLDKIKRGDSIFIIWNHQLYKYIVTTSFVVSPDTISILNPTVSPTLTLFTCTPLWTAINRLVIRASLQDQ